MAIKKVIRVRARRKDVVRLLRKLPGIAAGKVSGHGGMAQALLVRLGMALLGRVKKAFITKADGGTDETGLRWPPLSPKTIAYSRRHPRVLFPGKKRAPYAPSWMLTAAQRRRWWVLYRNFGGTAPQGAGYHAYGRSRNFAAAMAWSVLKREGARTLLGTYGNTKVKILRDTGLLLNSLSPGVVIGSGPAPQRAPKVKHQVFRLGPGEVIIGTNRLWSWTHHKGRPGKLPQRRLWPEPKTWPPSWWDEMLEQGQQGIVDIVIFMLTRVRP